MHNIFFVLVIIFMIIVILHHFNCHCYHLSSKSRSSSTHLRFSWLWSKSFGRNISQTSWLTKISELFKIFLEQKTHGTSIELPSVFLLYSVGQWSWTMGCSQSLVAEKINFSEFWDPLNIARVTSFKSQQKNCSEWISDWLKSKL